jgi:hypothetical protein
MSSESNNSLDSGVVAVRLARAFEDRQTDYAIGGAIALGFWGEPRGTLDVDVTVFLPPDRPSEVVWLLQDVGCDVVATQASSSLREHGYCSVQYGPVRVDVFVPTLPFYDHAKMRRRRVLLGDQQVMVFDAETLAVFKMMFFRPKDLVDVQQMLRIQGSNFDRQWVRDQLLDLFGSRDPRTTCWDELVSEPPT